MKKILGLILVSTLLWSCGSQFSRSKYGRHMWNRSHGKVEKELKTTDEESKQDNSEKSFTESTKNTNPSVIANEDVQKLSENKSVASNENKSVSKSIAVKKENRSALTEMKTEKNKKPVLKKKSKKNRFRNTGLTPTQGGDANLIILVILAIILPPLGVYLKDDGITGLFWLTLILCLLVGGWFIGVALLGSGWGLAAILALLRVFDII